MLEECIKTIENNCGPDELVKISNKLHCLYSPFLLDQKVWAIIEDVLPFDIYNRIKIYKDSLLGHKIVNELAIKYFPGESTIKYHFIKNYLNRLNEVTTFELNVGKSRLDIGRINGKSIAYEIKTELDSLDKLDKQLFDYNKVFEYVYVIIHPCHLDKVIERIPDHVGVITYKLNKENCTFAFRKRALKNLHLSSIDQLEALNKKELDWIIKDNGNLISNNARIDKESFILEHFSSKKINLYFKKVLKRRYSKKWGYLCDNFENVLPVDVQTFFATQADPYWIYYKNSSIV